MEKSSVVCYYCGKRSSGAMRRMRCPYCGHRLPGLPSVVALGEHPQSSLRSLIAWAWVFTGLTLLSVVMTGVLRENARGPGWAAYVTFLYGLRTGIVIGPVVALTLVAADIGTSRRHGVAVLVLLLALGILYQVRG